MDLYDCHLHTEFSGDSQLTLEWVIAHAADLGLAGLCPTEHYDPLPTDPRFATTDLDGMRARHQRWSRAGLPVVLGTGLEVTYHPDAIDSLRSLAASRQFDLLIGSVHDLDGLYVREWVAHEERRSLPLKPRLAPFIEMTARMVETGVFGVVGHLDYVKKYVPGLVGATLLATFRDELAHILETVVAFGAVLEVNVSGLRHDSRETYPSTHILHLYRDLGGEAVTVGSDAHAPHHFGTLLPHGVGLAEAQGLRVIDWRSLPSRQSSTLTARQGKQK